ncbi:hypothetical protein JTE90_013937 [Oedothorax gibbosus]|uniref:Sialin n=1 Tax=Oedothorax gibbosus TaxID=931172 RepID=A0AAV6UCC8_9ARAC|nr:hypothetical protein JTE90_013937 [Oedothorax gibbosus]
MEGKTEQKKMFEFPGVRYIFAANGFLGLCVTLALRVNINVAIVAMVNGTAVYGHHNKTTSEECAAGSVPNNSSAQDTPQDGEFAWSPQLQGVVLGSFYYGYVITQIPGGRLAELVGGKWVFGLGNLATALLSLLVPTAARTHVGWLIAVLAVEGLAQGVTVPALNVLLGRWLPDSEKAVLNTAVVIGVNVGTVSAMPLAGFLCRSQLFGGWPAAFYVIGMFGCAWFVLWIFLVTDTPATHPFITKKELEYITADQRRDQDKKLPPIPWLKIAKSVPFWSVIITRVCQDWSFYIMVNDLPTFFATILHFEIQKNSFLSSVPHLMQTVVGLSVAFFADLVIRKKMAPTNFVRKFCNSVSGFGSALGLLGVCFAGCDVTLNVILFMYLISVAGFCFGGHALSLLDISPEYSGTLMGICNTLSNINGFLAPLFVGALTDKQQTLHQWRIVFGTTAALLTLATVIFAVFSTAEKQEWATPPTVTECDSGDKSRLIGDSYGSINKEL